MSSYANHQALAGLTLGKSTDYRDTYDQALKLADRGYVLENGHVVLSDTGDALLANEAVRSAYLGG